MGHKQSTSAVSSPLGTQPYRPTQQIQSPNSPGKNAKNVSFGAGTNPRENMNDSRRVNQNNLNVSGQSSAGLRGRQASLNKDVEEVHLDDPLRVLAQKYKDIGAMLFTLKDNLVAHEKHESEVLGKLIRKMEAENKVIVAFVNRLELSLSLAEKVNRDIKSKLVTVNVSISKIAAEQERYLNDEIEYPTLREKVLHILEKYYPEMFPNSDAKLLPFPEEQGSRVVRRPLAIENSPVHKRTRYDDILDTNIAEVLQQEREEAANELEQTVSQHNKLVGDLDQLNQKQEALQNEIKSAQSKIRDLREVDNTMYSSSKIDLDSAVRKSPSKNFVDAPLSPHRRKSDVESPEVMKQSRGNGLPESKDYGAKIRELERKVFDMRREAQELDRNYKDNISRLYTREEELQQMRSLNSKSLAGLDDSKYVAPMSSSLYSNRYGDINAPRRNFY